MSHTHFLYHIVFATKDRMPFIAAAWEAQLYAYIAGIIKNHNGLLMAIGSIADHVHLLVGLEPVTLSPDFMRDLKACSSKWVRRNHQPKFSWQRRYGAFTVSESNCAAVGNYIRDQKEHHQKGPLRANTNHFCVGTVSNLMIGIFGIDRFACFTRLGSVSSTSTGYASLHLYLR